MAATTKAQGFDSMIFGQNPDPPVQSAYAFGSASTGATGQQTPAVQSAPAPADDMLPPAALPDDDEPTEVKLVRTAPGGGSVTVSEAYGALDELDSNGLPKTITPEQMQDITNRAEASRLMSLGMIEGFFDGDNLTDVEMGCLKDGAGGMSKEMGLVASEAMNLLKDMAGVTGSAQPATQLVPEDTAAEQMAEEQAAPALNAWSYGGRRLKMLSVLGALKSAEVATTAVTTMLSFNEMTKTFHQLAVNCVSGNAERQTWLAELEEAGNHMRNFAYMQQHFISNGKDILNQMAGSMISYEEGRYEEFGIELGKALKKETLADATSSGGLPQDLPSEVQVLNVTTGFLNGLFGPDSTLHVSNDNDAEDNADINLHDCVSSNSQYFAEMWETMQMISQSAKSLQQQRAGASSWSSGPVQRNATEHSMMASKAARAMAFAMMGMPMALSKCHLTESQLAMIGDGIKGLGNGVHLNFDSGLDGVPPQKQYTEKMAEAMQDLTNGDLNNFGVAVGNVAQAFAQVVFPQKYYVDETGTLRQLIIKAEEGSGSAGENSALAPVVLAVTVLLLLAALLAIKSRRSLQGWNNAICDRDSRTRESFDEIESGVIESARSGYFADPATRKLLEQDEVE